MKAVCAFCGKDIQESVLSKRHYVSGSVPEHIYCDKQCRADADKKSGFFKQMSVAGKEGRSKAMPTSNREKPRRKK